MSTLKQPNGDDYPEAALKHLQDAEVLLKGRRFDGAAYLAGYVVECALKTLIQVESGRARHLHELTSLLNMMDGLAVKAKTGTAARVYLSVEAALRKADVLRWEPQMRYHSPKVTSSEAEAWLRDARLAYDRIVKSLILEGDI